MKVFYLTRQFYQNVAAQNLTEILQKNIRPYAMVVVKIGNNQYAIPFRHNIARNKHSHYYPTLEILNEETNKLEQSGLDYTKAVIIKSIDIDTQRRATIDTAEFNLLKGKDTVIANQFKLFIEDYSEAVKRKQSNQNLPRDYFLLETSALQYYHEELNLNQPAPEENEIQNTDN